LTARVMSPHMQYGGPHAARPATPHSWAIDTAHSTLLAPRACAPVRPVAPARSSAARPLCAHSSRHHGRSPRRARVPRYTLTVVRAPHVPPTTRCVALRIAPRLHSRSAPPPSRARRNRLATIVATPARRALRPVATGRGRICFRGGRRSHRRHGALPEGDCQMSWSTLWLAGCGSPSACPSGGTRGRLHVYIRAHWSLLSSSGSRLMSPVARWVTYTGICSPGPGGSRSARRCASSFSSSSSIHAPRDPAVLLVHAAARVRPPRAWPGQSRPSPAAAAAADVPAASSAAALRTAGSFGLARRSTVARVRKPSLARALAKKVPPRPQVAFCGSRGPPRAHVNVAFVVAAPDRLRVTASRAAHAAAHARVTSAADTRRGWLSEASNRSAARGRPPTGRATR
jgi:hypothetical protein